MNKISTLLVAGSLVAFSAPAMAQDSGSSFDGFRVQGVLGYDALQAGSSVDDDSEIDNDESIDGVVYGVQAGYDIDLGGAVVGLEAELTDSSAESEFVDGDFEGFGFGRVDAGRDLFVGARVGAKVTPDVLLYAKGGYTNAKLNILSNDGTTEYNEDFDLDGWRAGAGLEYALNPRTFVNLEYRYSNYSKGEVDFDGDLPDSERFGVDLDRHQVMAGVGVRF
ncbi:outer membrane protein [Qipengyuania qiaonensis]|uniref:Outer membrane beta-barrel protein n=1 Tax=Qipengyuania qiaonensis TaxID=2867240 RepID=A0ABS7J3N9_9SPHN|nr:outer membrane beta-barrel protein [Qipengyuania qiaonensis]MBX7480916.1 outer membrane beta-barrel protein [Qipengyuania qiaonensis]